MKKIEIKILETEGDCEGKGPSRKLGLFIGSPEEIISYALKNDMQKTYNYSLRDATVLDVTGEKTLLKAKVGQWGRVDYEVDPLSEEELIRARALNKLTPDE